MYGAPPPFRAICSLRFPYSIFPFPTAVAVVVASTQSEVPSFAVLNALRCVVNTIPTSPLHLVCLDLTCCAALATTAVPPSDDCLEEPVHLDALRLTSEWASSPAILLAVTQLEAICNICLSPTRKSTKLSLSAEIDCKTILISFLQRH